jgi:hypothetical protein
MRFDVKTTAADFNKQRLNPPLSKSRAMTYRKSPSRLLVN